MKFPSIKNLLSGGIETFLRFPGAIIVAAIGTFVTIYMIEFDPYEEQIFFNIVLTCSMGLPLFISLTVLSERLKLKTRNINLMRAGCFFILGIYYWLLPEKLTEVDLIRALLYWLALHALVTFIPFVKKGNLNGFWQYNKVLFIQFITASLYSFVLFGGLALAIFATDQLFNLNINDELYGDLWVFLVGIFNTWFFLSGVPKNFDALDKEESYPLGLKIFTQYVLIPLVSIYLIILYAYTIKILTPRQ